ncbi:MAG: (5-formylfuran-3-yl)methyl phosphate synthase [Thiotrichales bacterium]|nr:(5-formylfuran-3-yl)methyl phosphate synthase [Thiotrichales bacterium]
MLASVTSRNEAQCALQAGVDIIDLKDPSRGALGAVGFSTARDIVEYIEGRCLVSATAGDLPMQSAVIEDAVCSMSATGVDFVKLGVFDEFLSAGILELLEQFETAGINLVLVLFADRQPDLDSVFRQLETTRVHGVMLDTADKQRGNLLDNVDSRFLGNFLSLAREQGLITGLAGALRKEMIPVLLKLAPDYLGFRGALCNNNSRTGKIDPVALQDIRQCIPGQNTLFSECI